MENGTLKCSANYAPLTPISFLERSAIVYRDRVSIVYGDLKFTWKQTHDRCLRLASALSHLGISRGDVVAALAPNVPALYELHFGVPMAGAILSTLNISYDSSMLSVLLKRSEAKLLFVDYQLLDTAEATLKLLSEEGVTKLPSLVIIQDSPHHSSPASQVLEYESFLSTGKLDFTTLRPNDESDPIALTYTSGTTAIPKGVLYSHRGTYLNSLSIALFNEMFAMPVYLWTVPMFHCNGWGFTWAMAAQGGTNICLRNVTARGIFDSIFANKVTHMGGAPTVLNMIINAPAAERRPLPQKVAVLTAGAPPPPVVLFGIEKLGFDVTHSYGCTETYGPGTVCTWRPEWDSLSPNERAKIKSLQGLQHLGLEEVDVKDPVTMRSVPPDGKTIGEVMLRGNTVMRGYFKDIRATQEAFRGGWYRSGDLGVKHDDGYIEFKDRSLDVIISGGENISTIEIEAVIFDHPSVLEVAVVGKPDEHWGETPCAFVKLKDGCDVSGEDITKYCRDRLPHHMAPSSVVFGDLPKTLTGKTQKFVLRERAKAMANIVSKNE
ncbi:probable acyl-activating enzyme 1 peroxisomal [Phtheirospermum japonicum]|uniref:Probable acyl-activating enzyme 1 peroxisomal n=1 Tax=Phtheirospermum japonicum TaxID=374723 RepID=A0A830BF96_9LAMI|nr:probable acyl-activating enzyme 1 peroxisomal [Phtheirospermum japonicum]